MKCLAERSASRYRRVFNNPMRDHFETSLDSPEKFIKSRCVWKYKRDSQSSFAKESTNVAYNWIFYHRNRSFLDSLSVHLRSTYEPGCKIFRSSLTTNAARTEWNMFYRQSVVYRLIKMRLSESQQSLRWRRKNQS